MEFLIERVIPKDWFHVEHPVKYFGLPHLKSEPLAKSDLSFRVNGVSSKGGSPFNFHLRRETTLHYKLPSSECTRRRVILYFSIPRASGYDMYFDFEE